MPNDKKRKSSADHQENVKRSNIEFVNYENLYLNQKKKNEDLATNVNTLNEKINDLEKKLKENEDYYKSQLEFEANYINNLEHKLDQNELKIIELLKENEKLKEESSNPNSFLEQLFNSQPPIIFKIPIRKDKNINEKESKKECEQICISSDSENSEAENENDNEDYEILDAKFNNIDDLIELGKSYDPDNKVKYNINLKKLSKLVVPLEKLNKMIGMSQVKQTVIDQILYYLQNIDNKNNDMLHSVIEGPPGVGKTEVAKILGEIYRNLGILSNDKFKSVKRSDLIGGYLGQTAIKTQKVLDECDGGVLFIDEAYSLGNSEGKDSYSKECIDTLTRHLSENKKNFICIIAGYKESLNECFFKYNEGLERRFPYRFIIEKYTGEELYKIFIKILEENNWKHSDLNIDFFDKNIKYFLFNGGDMEILFHKCKIAHSRRVFSLSQEHKKKITMADLNLGLKLLLENENISQRNNENQNSILTMYT